MPTESKFLNINTAFLAILIALSGWTLNKVSILSEQMSTLTESKANMTREILALQVRLTTAEVNIRANEIALARMSK